MINMSFRRLLGCGALLALFSLAALSFGQTDPNAIFATVNGEEIKSQEFWHRLAWYRVDPKSPMATFPAGFLTINELITERLVYQMARAEGVSPTDTQVSEEVRLELQGNPTLIQDMKSDGRPESDLYEDVKYQLAQYNLKTFGITITDQEVEQHYHDYPTEFTSPKAYHLSVIAVNNDADQQSVDQDLAAGKSFADVAKARSLDSLSAANGGDYGTVPESSLSATALSAINAVKIGEATQWVTSTQANSFRIKYLLVDIVPPKLQPLDDKARRALRRRLALDKGAVKNNVFLDLQKATVNANVVIHQAGFQKIYDELIRQYKHAHPGTNPNPN
jgi:foldase protein PrsA